MSHGTDVVYRCGTAARWLPRTVAGTVLVAGLLAVGRLDAGRAVPGAHTFRALLIVATAIAALWIVRKGAEVRLQVRVDDTALTFEWGRSSVSLPLDKIDAIRYEPPFGASRNWLPAAVLVDRDGREWRLSALLGSGDRLVDDIVRLGGREGLATWAAEHHVGREGGPVRPHMRPLEAQHAAFQHGRDALPRELLRGPAAWLGLGRQLPR